MSGVELDPDGTDSYHPEHPWEQHGHPLYIDPTQRTRSNWPPAVAQPHGPWEAKGWRMLPDRPAPGVELGWFGPGHSYPAESGNSGEGSSNADN